MLLGCQLEVFTVKLDIHKGNLLLLSSADITTYVYMKSIQF